MKDGFVYFIRGSESGLIKIGYSTDVASRARGLCCTSREPLTILASVDGNLVDEQILHRRFASQRQSGEWFSPSDELLDYIRNAAVPWAGGQPEWIGPPDEDGDDGLLDVPRITRLRESVGMTKADAARAAGMSPQRWNDIESGRKINLELRTLASVADALGCDPCDLLRKPKATE